MTKRTLRNRANHYGSTPVASIDGITAAGEAMIEAANAAAQSALLNATIAPTWTNVSGKPSTFAPSAHTHPASEISDSTAAGRSMLTAANAAAQTALLDSFSSGAKGLAPASGGGTSNFLRADGTWAAPAAGGLSDGDKGDITVSASGATWTIDNGAVSLAKMADMATASVIYRKTAGTGAPEVNTLATLKTDMGLDAYYGVLTADYTLTSTVAAQKAFNWSTNGALTLPTGYYRFIAMLQITTMSGTSGNAQFQLLGGGTATLANIFYHGVGIDNANPLAAGTQTGSFSTTSNSAASIVTGGTPTALGVEINGVFNVTASGTIIPSVALVTAAAGVMKAGSFFRCERIGATGSNTSSGWT